MAENNTTVMSPTGGVLNRDIYADKYSYITLVGSGGDDTATMSINRGSLLVRAPLDRVRIRDLVDYDISRALSGDFLLSTFGRQPVSITLSGIDIYGSELGTLEYSYAYRIQAFWSHYNVHTNPKYRVRVSIYGVPKCVYTCVLIGMSCGADGHGVVPASGVGDYELDFIGVPDNG